MWPFSLFLPPDVDRLEARKDVKGLIRALRNKDRDIREAAAWALGELKDRRAVGPLISLLERDKESGNAAWALGQLGDGSAVGILIAALSSEALDVRTNAAGALGFLGQGEAVEPLILALGDEQNWIRQNAAVSLGRIGDERAIGPLTKSLRDSDAEVRSNAIEALRKIGDVTGQMQMLCGSDFRDVRLIDMYFTPVELPAELGARIMLSNEVSFNQLAKDRLERMIPGFSCLSSYSDIFLVTFDQSSEATLERGRLEQARAAAV